MPQPENTHSLKNVDGATETSSVHK